MPSSDHEALWECVYALRELVRLKRIKDSQGKTAEYLKMRPRAWREAREALGAAREALRGVAK